MSDTKRTLRQAEGRVHRNGQANSESLPIDFEECGYCGFDHEYEYESAYKWHEENDPNGELYK